MVGVVMHIRGVIKKYHSLGGDLLSQLFQHIWVMDALPFSKLRKFLSCGPRPVFTSE